MKWSNRILVSLLLVLLAGIFASNLAIKKEFEKKDKNDPYWNYGKVLEQSFKYLKIEGGNFTHVIYEPGPDCSVRVLNDWQRYNPELIRREIRNDTLFIHFIYSPKNPGEREWMNSKVLVRIFSPELLSVEGVNTDFEMIKTNQNSLALDISGRSRFEMESLVPEMNDLSILQKDSSAVVIEMSPDYRNGTSFHAKRVRADVSGVSMLDLGHGQIDSLQLKAGDHSAVLLSGAALKKVH